MQLTFLGKETQGGGSPTLYSTDRDTYLVQGWRVDEHQASVEIPQRLLGYLEPHTSLDGVLLDTGRGSFVIAGTLVTDPASLSQLDMPGYETCIEVGKRPAPIEGRGSGTASR